MWSLKPCEDEINLEELYSKGGSPDELGNEFGLKQVVSRLLSWYRIKTTYVMRKIGIHDDDKVARNKVQTMNICSPGKEFRWEVKITQNNYYPRPSFPARGFKTWLTACWIKIEGKTKVTHNLVFPVNFGQLVCNFLSTIRAVVVDNNDFPW